MTAVATDSASGAMPAWLPAPVRFVLVSGAAAVVNFIARILLGAYVPFAQAIILAFLIGMATAFLLNRRFVFQAATRSLNHQVFWFVAVNLLALIQTLAVSLLLANYALPFFGVTWHAETIAHGIGIAFPIFTSYLGHKHLTFR